MKGILLRKADELNNACRNHFEQLKNYLKENNRSSFSTREVRAALRINASNQKRYMGQLLTNGFIKKSTGTKAKGFTYEVVSYEEYQELQNTIASVLDQTLQKLKGVVQSSSVVQRRAGLLKPKTDKTLAEVVQ